MNGVEAEMPYAPACAFFTRSAISCAVIFAAGLS
jgi:hypothetical protein